MRWLAPAKVNLSLRILGRRSDGFHDLQSLMVPVSVCDALEIALKDGGELEFMCSAPGVPQDEGNLVVQAVRLFCSAAGVAPRLRITLEKAIPHGAGLGGGSSDAATTLLALDALFETGMSLPALCRIAAEIGSDVPFFLSRSAAWIGGRGEIVEPVEGLESVPLLLVKPPFGVPTPWAYKQWKDSTEIPDVSYGEQSTRAGMLVNDLERPVFQKYLFLADLKRWLMSQPEVEGALMSGSGSTVFAVLRETCGAVGLTERLALEFGTQLWVQSCETKPSGV